MAGLFEGKIDGVADAKAHAEMLCFKNFH